MQATICGETHKIYFGNSTVEEFLKNEKINFQYLLDKGNTLYNHKTLVNDVAINYLNVLPENKQEESLKNTILSEYYRCENIYPYLGDYFLFKLFDQKTSSRKIYRFNKRHQENFVNSLSSKITKEIVGWIFENSNLKHNINVNHFFGEEIVIEYVNDYVFSFAYDYNVVSKINHKNIKNYKFIIINGVIESVGEIHHLLHNANIDKVPYVFFCYGISEEVKTTIIKNNKAGRFKVFPVCLDANDENTLNVMNDLAVIHGSFVVSSDLGQTISQEVRKELKSGNEITFCDNCIKIKPNVSESDLKSHRQFLKDRIRNATRQKDVNADPLYQRLKSFSTNNLNIYLPDILRYDKKQNREMDYVFNFFKNIQKNTTIVTMNNQKFYMPTDYIKISHEKLESLKNNLNNIQVIIT